MTNLIPFVTDMLDEFYNSFGSDFLLKENHLELKIYVPGVPKKDLGLSYDTASKRLLVKKNDKIIKSYRIRSEGILDVQNTDAELKDGVLCVKIPRIRDETNIKVK